ncbi:MULTISPECIES: alpha/beta family hydrolase [Pseudoalteromonas]|uniref:alpha/beta family hydrolase n=1 Tax=Pseudoalteromonas TaxID=53246 RepID=UPI0016012BA4|nr:MULTISPECIES: alpha/beta family hydrolase [unclassified Pseudoalteromonas]MBB1418693.1 alpha/beta hydrolase [Pseudoalteromonas sp. SG44-1]MBB1434889.1 alpha/beta hydrolase [Pseudoalteromonas sp. SG43-6]MBB1481434.1 alpha/beta hydrolase [Pseudoalteromonas sp. SG41-2]
MTIEWIKSDQQPALAQFIFAHGAGAASDSEFMQKMASLLAEKGIDVGLFDFEYMQIAKQNNKRRPPDRAPKLLQYFAHILTFVQPSLPLFIGGKSMGGRMASMLVSEERVTMPPISGVLAFGYPFHPPGKPDKLRIDHFGKIPCPFMVLQGERDTFGTRDELTQLQLDKRPEFVWLADGDHSLKPRKRSGFTELGNVQTAAEHAASFIKQHI